MKKNLNQKLINLIEYYNLINANLLLSNKNLQKFILLFSSLSYGLICFYPDSVVSYLGLGLFGFYVFVFI